MFQLESGKKASGSAEHAFCQCGTIVQSKGPSDWKNPVTNTGISCQDSTRETELYTISDYIISNQLDIGFHKLRWKHRTLVLAGYVAQLEVVTCDSDSDNWCGPVLQWYHRWSYIWLVSTHQQNESQFGSWSSFLDWKLQNGTAQVWAVSMLKSACWANPCLLLECIFFGSIPHSCCMIVDSISFTKHLLWSLQLTWVNSTFDGWNPQRFWWRLIPGNLPPLLHLYFGLLSKPLTLEGGEIATGLRLHILYSSCYVKELLYKLCMVFAYFHPLHVEYASMNTYIFETSMCSSLCFCRCMRAYRLKNQQVLGNRFAYG